MYWSLPVPVEVLFQALLRPYWGDFPWHEPSSHLGVPDLSIKFLMSRHQWPVQTTAGSDVQSGHLQVAEVRWHRHWDKTPKEHQKTLFFIDQWLLIYQMYTWLWSTATASLIMCFYHFEYRWLSLRMTDILLGWMCCNLSNMQSRHRYGMGSTNLTRPNAFWSSTTLWTEPYGNVMADIPTCHILPCQITYLFAFTELVNRGVYSPRYPNVWYLRMLFDSQIRRSKLRKGLKNQDISTPDIRFGSWINESRDQISTSTLICKPDLEFVGSSWISM